VFSFFGKFQNFFRKPKKADSLELFFLPFFEKNLKISPQLDLRSPVVGLLKKCYGLSKQSPLNAKSL
jgi:hypothetical protein